MVCKTGYFVGELVLPDSSLPLRLNAMSAWLSGS
jgi:hypothetical protein